MPDINVKVYDLSILAQQQSILSNISSLSTPNNSISDFYFDNIFFKQSIQYIYFYEQLITNNNINYSTYTNILLIDKTVSNYLTFFNSANNFTYPNIGEYDYIIRLNMSLNDFFTTRTYQQSVSNIDNTIVTFEINQDNFNLAYNNTLMDANRDALIRGIEYTTSCDTRVLEILALKIFGHAKSRSAIKNDTNIISDVKDNLFNFFNNIVQTYKMDIFNQYIQYDLVDINTNDVGTPVNFNFTNDIIDFPGYISGSLLNIGQLSQELLNGPISGNSTSLVNGIYNVPILIKFG